MTTKPDDKQPDGKRPTWEDHAAEVRSLLPIRDANGNVVKGNHLPHDPSDPDGWWAARSSEARASHNEYQANRNVGDTTHDYDGPEWDKIRRDHKWERPGMIRTEEEDDSEETSGKKQFTRKDLILQIDEDPPARIRTDGEDDKESPGEERFVDIVVGVVTTMIVGGVGLLFWAIAPHTIFPVAVFLWGIATWIAGILWTMLSVVITVVLFPLLWLWSVLAF